MAATVDLPMPDTMLVNSDSRGLYNYYPLLRWNDLPTWRRDNEYIISGYRTESRSFRKSLESWTHISNETVNIYSHLFGAVLFSIILILVCLALRQHYPASYSNDTTVFAAFFFGIIICFLLSATFHTIANHSDAVAALGNQLDYLGIVLLIWGALVPSIYYGFYCDPELQKVYWAVVSFAALTCAIVTFSSVFRSPALRPYRAAIYTALGLSTTVFITHGLIIHGWEIQNRRMSITYMIGTAGLNIIGAVVYAARIPEKLHLGRFDIYGQSHQILHFLVIFAGLTHTLGLLRAADFVHSQTHQCL